MFLRLIRWREEKGQGRGARGETYHALLDASTGEELWRVDLEDRKALNGRPFPGTSVMFTPNGEEVLSVGSSWIRRYSAATGEPIGEKIDLESEDSVRNVFFNEDDAATYGGGRDASVQEPALTGPPDRADSGGDRDGSPEPHVVGVGDAEPHRRGAS